MKIKSIFKFISSHIAAYIRKSLKIKLVTSIGMVLFIFIIAILLNNIIMAQIIRNKINKSIMGNINQTDKYLSFVFKSAQEIAGELALSLYEEDYIRRLFNENIEKLT
jgi:hypothetical protein